jgi:molecular chaperone DnaK
MVSDAEAHADDDRRARELAEARNNGENSAYQAERQLRELGDSVDDASRTQIEDAIKAIRDVLEGEDPDVIRQRTDALNEAFHHVSEQIYARASESQSYGSSGNGSTSDDGAGDEDVVDAEVVDEQSA